VITSLFRAKNGSNLCLFLQETFGAMAKTEKIYYILEQVRLCLDRKDFVRAQIMAKKVSPRAFAEQPKKEEKPGDVGIEGTTIEQPDKVFCSHSLTSVVARTLSILSLQDITHIHSTWSVVSPKGF
jgi:hypothetical protein